MIIVMGTFRMPEENIEAALPMAAKVVAATQSEDGCIQYSYSRDLIEPGLFHVSERWRDRAALAVHFKAPHMAVWAQERAGLGLYDRNIRIFETDEGEAV
jgi:quinol monooxygenase YgiN